MHCLVVTNFCCVDNHFTSFIAILLLLTMNFIILYVQYMGKTACYVYRISHWYRLFSNNGYRKMEKFDIGTPLIVGYKYNGQIH